MTQNQNGKHHSQNLAMLDCEKRNENDVMVLCTKF